MVAKISLEVFLQTDVVTGEIDVTIQPEEEGGLQPIPVEEWTEIREKLRGEILNEISNKTNWKSYLDSNRMGERLSVKLGSISIDEEGEIVRKDVEYKGPENINWK